MTAPATETGARAAALRAAFDRTFAEPPPTAPAWEELLAVRIGGDPYALRLAEVAGVHADVAVTPLPSPIPEFAGVAFFRGSIVPVYDLRRLLGYGGGSDARWLVRCRPPVAIGLAFDRFESHRRVRADELVPADAKDRGRGHVTHLVTIDGVVRPLVQLGSLVSEVASRRVAGAAGKDR